jgi:hypothetical protein
LQCKYEPVRNQEGENDIGDRAAAALVAVDIIGQADILFGRAGCAVLLFTLRPSKAAIVTLVLPTAATSTAATSTGEAAATAAG